MLRSSWYGSARWPAPDSTTSDLVRGALFVRGVVNRACCDGIPVCVYTYVHTYIHTYR